MQADDPGQGRPSNHRVAVISAKLPRIDAFRWIKYAYRYYNEESVEKFKTTGGIFGPDSAPIAGG